MLHNPANCDWPPDTAALAAAPRRTYPSDLTDRQWRKVYPLLPPPPTRPGRPRETDLREVLSAINYRWTTGCPWRMLPHDFPPWGTVYTYFRQWDRAGLLPDLRLQLLRSAGRRSTGVPERFTESPAS